jgi:glutamate formiminotransferase/formiminotetrahydrofolate cyclodeaminase
VEVARKIARAIRLSSGGMRYLKALGLLVEGRAQVSMNFTNFRETPLARVIEMIRREAARHGTSIHHSELVGLIPQEALTNAAIWYMQLDAFSPEQVLESRLYAARASDTLSVDPDPCTFLDELAAPTPTPGGGSAAAYAAAMAAALIAMVAGLTVGKKKYVEVEAEMRDIVIQAESLRTELTHIVDDDAAAFEAVMGAHKLPKDTPEQVKARIAAIEIATLNAAHIPLHVAEYSVKLMTLAARCVELGNLNTISDAASATALAKAALTSAGYNVRVNVKGMRDKDSRKKLLGELHKFEAQAIKIEKTTYRTMENRGGLAS